MPRNPVLELLHQKLEELFSEDELALIWSALNSYDVGPKESDPRLWEALEERRQELLAAFE